MEAPLESSPPTQFASLPPEEHEAPPRHIPVSLVTVFFTLPILAVSLYFGGTLLYPQNHPETYKSEAQTPMLSPIPTAPAAEAPAETTTINAQDDWTSYTNTKYGYTFSYPSAYFILPQNNPELNSISITSYVSLPSSLENQYKLDIIYSGQKAADQTMYEYIRNRTADSGGGILKEVQLGQVTGYRTPAGKTIYIEKNNYVFFINTYPFSRSSITTKILASFKFLN